jgi:VanZ family protein
LKRLLLWAPACAYMALIFFASSVPGDELPGHFWDKGAHLIVYAGLGVLFLLPLAAARLSQVTTKAAGIAILLSTLHGMFDEVHQAYTPGRSPDVRDVVADALGAAAGVAAVLILRALLSSRRGRSQRDHHEETELN